MTMASELSELTTEQYTNECRHHGIRPDDRIVCARSGKVGTVWPYEWWGRVKGAGFIVGVSDDEQSNLWAFSDGKWAVHFDPSTP